MWFSAEGMSGKQESTASLGMRNLTLHWGVPAITKEMATRQARWSSVPARHRVACTQPRRGTAWWLRRERGAPQLGLKPELPYRQGVCCATPLAPQLPSTSKATFSQAWHRAAPLQPLGKTDSGLRWKAQNKTQNPGQLSLLLPEGFHQYNGSKYNTFLRAVERAYNWNRSFWETEV